MELGKVLCEYKQQAQDLVCLSWSPASAAYGAGDLHFLLPPFPCLYRGDDDITWIIRLWRLTEVLRLVPGTSREKKKNHSGPWGGLTPAYLSRFISDHSLPRSNHVANSLPIPGPSVSLCLAREYSSALSHAGPPNQHLYVLWTSVRRCLSHRAFLGCSPISPAHLSSPPSTNS